MKTTILKTMAITALLMALTAVAAQAQTSLNRQKFTVPFDFSVGKTVLPAGEYTVFAENETIRLRRDDGKGNAVALSQRIVRENSGNSVKLTFHRYGDHLYLSQVLLADGIGRELKKQRRANTEVVQNFDIVEVEARTASR